VCLYGQLRPGEEASQNQPRHRCRKKRDTGEFEHAAPSALKPQSHCHDSGEVLEREGGAYRGVLNRNVLAVSGGERHQKQGTQLADAQRFRRGSAHRPDQRDANESRKTTCRGAPRQPGCRHEHDLRRSQPDPTRGVIVRPGERRHEKSREGRVEIRRILIRADAAGNVFCGAVVDVEIARSGPSVQNVNDICADVDRGKEAQDYRGGDGRGPGAVSGGPVFKSCSDLRSGGRLCIHSGGYKRTTMEHRPCQWTLYPVWHTPKRAKRETAGQSSFHLRSAGENCGADLWADPRAGQGSCPTEFRQKFRLRENERDPGLSECRRPTFKGVCGIAWIRTPSTGRHHTCAASTRGCPLAPWTTGTLSTICRLRWAQSLRRCGIASAKYVGSERNSPAPSVPY